jgi:hypothetical protein
MCQTANNHLTARDALHLREADALADQLFDDGRRRFRWPDDGLQIEIIPQDLLDVLAGL